MSLSQISRFLVLPVAPQLSDLPLRFPLFQQIQTPILPWRPAAPFPPSRIKVSIMPELPARERRRVASCSRQRQKIAERLPLRQVDLYSPNMNGRKLLRLPKQVPAGSC